MTPAPLTAAVQSLFVLLALSLAGTVHVLWLRSAWARCFDQPLDAGLRWRGHRVFGDNKRLCGFMVLPPAAALSFLLLGGVRDSGPVWWSSSLWSLSATQYASLGFVCGLAFMLAELPNSFFKRQLGIAPGHAPQQGWLRQVFLCIDRFDSALGVLLVLSLCVPVSWVTWLCLLVLGPSIHAAFSLVMHRLGMKIRAL